MIALFVNRKCRRRGRQYKEDFRGTEGIMEESNTGDIVVDTHGEGEH